MSLSFFRGRSLKTRVTLFTLGIFLAGLWSLAFYASRMLREDMQRLLGEQQFSTVSFMADVINHELDTRVSMLKKVAGALNPAVLADTSMLEKDLEKLLLLQSAFNGGIIAYGLDGTALAQVAQSPTQISANNLDTETIAAVLKAGHATIGKPHRVKNDASPEFGITVPIVDAKGQVIGALGGVITLEKPNFLDKVTQGRYGKTGGYVLAAPQHQLIVTASNKSRIMAVLPAAGISSMMDRYAKGYEGTDIFVNPIGVEVLASVKGIPAAGWYIAASLPTDESFAPIQAMQRRMLLATLFFTLLAGGLTWWMLRRQLSPMLAAARRLTQLSDTNQFPQALPITSHDEIGELIGRFNLLLTTLRQRDEALRVSEERNRAITQSAFDAIVTADSAGHIAGWNRGAEIIFGYTEAEIMGQPMTCLIPERYQAGHLAGMKRVQSGGPHHVIGKTVELNGLRKDGSEFPLDLSLAKWENADGWFITGIIRDITERKAHQMQSKLAAQVFAQGREGITVADAHGNIVMVNKAFTEITGYTEAEVLGKNPRILSSGRQSPEFYRAMWNALMTEGNWAGETWNRRKDGSMYPEWLAISAMRDDDGQISHYVGSFSDLSDAKAAEGRIEWLSHFDPLTGLPNRALLQDRTRQSISMAQRAGEPLTMMLVGIDHFKNITDTWGHDIGDHLLMEMAQRLGGSVRAQDTVAQLAGKEFVLVLPGTPSDGAAHLATELLSKLAQPYPLDDQELTVTASIGIARYPDNGVDFDSLFKSVEIAMHRAQTHDQGTFQFYSEEMYQQVFARDQMVKALRNAVALEQLQLLYQPLVDLQTGHISGLEALLRWHHPELGSVAPTQFIPLAEEAGLINSIGRWVLRRACRDIRIWLDKGIKVPHVAVNVSPLQFRDAGLIAQVKAAMSESQVAPALLYIEVTEGALMDDVQRSEAMLKELKDLGVKLSLDDFGTGYSSLSYLKRFPFDKVKIDQSFVRDITSSQNDNVLVQVIVSMAHGLGLKVIAEGVETEAQCEILRTHVCDEIQGYFFSKPISALAIEQIFAQDKQLPANLLRLRKPQRTLLLVDDEPNVLSSLKRLFRRDGHIILTANSGAEGLEMLAQHKVDVIISDQRMPGMTGVEFLRAAKQRHPDTIRIVLSGYTELQSVTDAINEGAVYRFLTKPWEDEQLRDHIHKAFEYKELLEENQQLDLKIKTTNQELVAANRQLGEVLQSTRHQVMRDETSLAIVREALQHMPLPVICVDDEGLMAFVNAAAERLFAKDGPLLGVELAHALPQVDIALAGIAEDAPGALEMGLAHYQIKWNAMGANSRSRGKVVTFTKIGLDS